MRLSEILDTAVRLYRANWKTFMSIVALIVVPYLLVQSFATRGAYTNPFDPNATPSTDTTAEVLTFVFTLLNFVFLAPLLTGAVARAAVQVYQGETPAVRPTFRFALSRVWAILWVTLLAALATILGFILLIIPGFLVFVRTSFGAEVVVIEDVRGRKAIGRSWRLAKGHFWKIFGTLFLAGIMAAIVGGILEIPLTLAAIPLGSAGWPLRALGAIVGGVVTRPFAALVGVLLYFDMRVRKEGLDIALMAREVGLQP